MLTDFYDGIFYLVIYKEYFDLILFVHIFKKLIVIFCKL